MMAMLIGTGIAVILLLQATKATKDDDTYESISRIQDFIALNLLLAFIIKMIFNFMSGVC